MICLIISAGNKDKAGESPPSRSNNGSALVSGLLKPAILFFLLLLVSCAQDEADDYFHMGEKSFASGQLGEAARFYELFLDANPESPQRITAWERLLLIYLDIGGDMDQGLNILRSMSVECQADQERLWSIYMRIGGLLVSQKSFERAIEILKRAAEVARDDSRLVSTYLDLAQVYYSNREFREALEVLNHFPDSAYDLSPDETGRINYLLGKIHYQLKDKKSAITCLHRTLYSEAEKNLRSKAGMLLYEIYLEEADTSAAEEILVKMKRFYPNPMVIRTRMDDLP